MEKVLHHTNQSCEKPVSIPAILCGTKVAITPIDDHMLYGGTMEITGTNNKININTVKGIIETVPKLFPNLRVELSEKKDSWSGFWPCSPDGLSYISSSKKIKNLIIAGGHPLLGFSLSPATGKLVSELANGYLLCVNADAFDPERF